MDLTPFHGPPAVPPGVPGFALHTLIGFGAHGEVWLAEDLSNGAQVALKVGHPAGPEPNAGGGSSPARLLSAVGPGHLAGATADRETALLCRIDHPHIVRLQRVVLLDDGRLAMVLDLAAGGSLASLIAARGRFDPGEVSTLLIPLAGALEHLHRLGVVHGDISPGNVLFTGDGRPQLGDLGVAQVLGGRGEEVWATPGFADPALSVGGPLDQRAADVWGLAAVAWFALSGGPPTVSGDLRVELPTVPSPGPGDPARRADRAHLADLADRSDQAGDLTGLLAQCLAIDPAERPGLAELADRAWQAAHPVPVRLIGERPAAVAEVGLLPPLSRQVTRQVVDRVPQATESASRPAPRAQRALGAGRKQGRSGRGAAEREATGRSGQRPANVPVQGRVAAVVDGLRGAGRRHLAGAVTVAVAVLLLAAVAVGLTSAVGVPGRAHRAEAVAGGSGGQQPGAAEARASLTAELGQALVEIGRSRAGAFAAASSTGLVGADQEGSPAYLADDALVRRLQARGVRLQGVSYLVEQVRVLRRVGSAVEVGAMVTTSRHRQVATAAKVSVAVPVDGPRRMIFTVVPSAEGLPGPARWRVQNVRPA